MAPAKVRQLQPLPRLVVADPEQPLPRADWETYQQQLFADFLVSRRANAGGSTVHNTLTALRANFLPWLADRGRYVWEVTPADLDAWSLALKNAVMTRTHRQ